MALSSLFFPSRFFPTSTTAYARNTPSPHTCLPASFHSFIRQKYWKREFPLPAVASVPYQPINLDYLQNEFSRNGVTFDGVGNSCIAKMELKNGSIAMILLPSGLITSYKAPMWHGGKVELLHTAVSEGENRDAIIQGGVSMNIYFETDDGEVSWTPAGWVLHDIKGNAEESIQVELINRTPQDNIGLKHTVILKEDGLISQLEVLNSSSFPLQMTGSILSHLTVSTPDATYAIGLERSNYSSTPLLESEFILNPPDSDQGQGYGKLWKSVALKQLVPGWGTKTWNSNQAKGTQGGSEDMDGEEMDGYKHLRDKISLVYTDAPRSFTVIDRGRRNSVSIVRSGFDEMYLFSPGSSIESYSKYSYILVGQAAILKPIVINPQDVWSGGQHLHNPNL